ncbi:hypothetical protein POTOM_059711 [Populus tomentosa]|uniref:OVATE domain-containing protein n=1 Tax=Populus tomentosa TaxID=118781 RepID=A0A8X7XTH3_POPTO|nr:hypothetical protein POTOM_059711 [Populus tomentosa]
MPSTSYDSSPHQDSCQNILTSWGATLLLQDMNPTITKRSTKGIANLLLYPFSANSLSAMIQAFQSMQETTDTLQIQAQKTCLYKRKSRKMDRVSELRSVSEPECERMLFPSPLTPAYIKASLEKKRRTFGDEDVGDACRSFENYLVEMMVEEGQVMDLMDVEELLYCWKNLKCPVFIDLVGRFYGELCKDLFSPDDDNTDINSPK